MPSRCNIIQGGCLLGVTKDLDEISTLTVFGGPGSQWSNLSICRVLSWWLEWYGRTSENKRESEKDHPWFCFTVCFLLSWLREMCNSILGQWVEDNRVDFLVCTCTVVAASPEVLQSMRTDTELVRQSWSIPFWWVEEKKKKSKKREKIRKKSKKEEN